MVKGLKIGLGSLVAVGFVGLKFAAYLGLGAGIAEAEIAASKHQRWPASFKSEFVTTCAEEGTAEEKPFLTPYCDCIASKIENAHVIATKYNSLTETQTDYGVRTAEQVKGYLTSKDGIAAADDCSKSTQALFK